MLVAPAKKIKQDPFGASIDPGKRVYQDWLCCCWHIGNSSRLHAGDDRQCKRWIGCGCSLAVVIDQVIIDGRAARRSETGGVERWAKELCRRLPELNSSHYSVADPGKAFSHRLGHLWEQTVLPAQAELQSSALLCPANLAPLAGRRNIVVLHDAAPLRFPNDFSKQYQRWQQFLLPRLAQGALRVIVPSEFSRSEVIELCGADPANVDVAYGGVPVGYTPEVDPTPVLELLGIEAPYVLTVASHVKRKNLTVLGRVAERLAEDGVQLVAVGGGRPQFGPSGVGTSSQVKLTGPLDESMLPSLYAGARAFVLPSVYEGFGLPVCEAMAAGTPVVCSDRAALPEAAGGAAILVNPDDVVQLEEAVLTATFNESARSDLVQRGLSRVEPLTWDATAKRIDEICADACGWF